RAKTKTVDGVLAHQNRGCGTVRGGRALQLRQRAMVGRRGEDLFQAVDVLELRARVLARVTVVLLSDHGEVLGGRSVALHVLETGVAEQLERDRPGRRRTAVPGRCEVRLDRARAIRAAGPQ